MDPVEEFINELKQDLERTDPLDQLKLIQRRLASIKDPAQRKIAETMVEIVLSIGTPSTGKHVIVLLHGIRTHAEWQGMVKNELSKINGVIVYPVGYGYLDVLGFWFPYFSRKIQINKILVELRDIRINHRTDRITVVAHSFGTYVIGQILENNSDIVLHHLLLCGSVIKQSFKWNMLSKFPSGKIVNDCGSRDIWPILAKLLSWGYGPSGTFGFQTAKVEDRHHNFKHSDYFDSDFIQKCWVPIISGTNDAEQGCEAQRKKIPYWMSLLSIIPLKTSVLALLLYMVFW